jgi:predicted nucleic acid-binding protein
MILLDTDHLSLLLADHPRVADRFRAATEEVATTIISRIEALDGRFAFLLKAADAEQLLRAQEWLRKTEADLTRFRIVPIDAGAAREFSRLRGNKKRKRIGRADLLIAAIALAHRATLASRNLKDFHQVPGLQVENWAD